MPVAAGGSAKLLSNSRTKLKPAKPDNKKKPGEFITPSLDDANVDATSLLGVMPSPSDCIMQDVLFKLNHLYEWTPRQLAMTKSALCFCFEGDQAVRDSIFLHEVRAFRFSLRFSFLFSFHNNRLRYTEQVTFVSKRDQVPGLNASSSPRQQSVGWNQSAAWHQIKEKDEKIFAFEVQTHEEGYNSGRSYYFRAETQERRNEWVAAIGDAVTACKLRKQAANSSKLRLARIRCKKIYDSGTMQGFVACLIFGNFIANVAQAEVQPEAGSLQEASFNASDTFFTGAAPVFSPDLSPVTHLRTQSPPYTFIVASRAC